MVKNRIVCENGYIETLETPIRIERIQTMFVCGGVEFFTFADAQVYQVENSPKDDNGNITEFIPITESESELASVAIEGI